jgi:tRNA(His) 5'-end guanylyltransferase
MNKDSLGDRMKSYEACYNMKMPRRLPAVLRVDGKAFHSMVKRWKCEKPFDQNLVGAMQETALHLCQNISGAVLGYVQSDEISIVLRNDQTIHTQPWFDNKVQKIASVSASLATAAFNNAFKYCMVGADDINQHAVFDCRVWVMPQDEVQNYMVWRQQDASRNSVSMLARGHFSHKQVQGKNVNQMQDMLMLEKGINWNDLDTCLKRGTCIIKKSAELKTPSGDAFFRDKWHIDKEIPVFTQLPDYVKSRLV